MGIRYINKYEQDIHKTLQNLVKYNGGNFKSQKQADFIKTWNTGQDNDILERWKFKPEHMLQDGEFIITVDGEITYGDRAYIGNGQNVVPYTLVYTMDKHGVKRIHRLKYQANKFYDEYYGVKRVSGWSPCGNELKWERTEVTFYPEEKPAEQPEEAEKPVSEWIGTVGEKRQFTAKLTFRKWIKTAYGSNLLMAFTTEEGNILKTFYSGYNGDILGMKQGETYTFTAVVKEHSEYKDEKQTMIQRITDVKKASVPV